MNKKEITKKIREFFKGTVTITEFGKVRGGDNACDIVLNASKLENLINEENLENVFYHIFGKLFPNYHNLTVQVYEYSDISIYMDFE